VTFVNHMAEIIWVAAAPAACARLGGDQYCCRGQITFGVTR